MTTPPGPEWLERANRLALLARQLSSTIHDVNNALQVIGGSVELLQSAPAASDMIQRRVTAIDAQTKRATRLLQELSEFLRDGRIKAERVDVAACCRQVTAARHYSLTKLRVDAAVDGAAVATVSPRHLQQILMNLFVNAEDALAAGTADGAPARIAIAVSQDGDQAIVSITDNAAAEGGKPQGTVTIGPLGIGLEVSEWLAQQNGGTLTREPLTGGGSAATLRLPASRG